MPLFRSHKTRFARSKTGNLIWDSIDDFKISERLKREGEPLPEDLENLDNLSPEEKKAMDAERRAAWRKARLKSLENVSRNG